MSSLVIGPRYAAGEDRCGPGSNLALNGMSQTDATSVRRAWLHATKWNVRMAKTSTYERSNDRPVTNSEPDAATNTREEVFGLFSEADSDSKVDQDVVAEVMVDSDIEEV